MNSCRRLVLRGGSVLPLLLALVAPACSSSQDENPEKEEQALTCPKGYHSACDGTRTPSGQCIGTIACQDANGNWAVADHNPKCGQIGQVCCPSPIDGPSCYAGFCNGGAGGTCTACGATGQISCEGICNSPDTYLDSNQICRACSDVVVQTHDIGSPRYLTDTTSVPPPNATVITGTGPTIPGGVKVWYTSNVGPVQVTISGNNGVTETQSGPSPLVFNNLLLRGPASDANSTIPTIYNVTTSYKSCSDVSPRSSFWVPFSDATNGTCDDKFHPTKIGQGSMVGPVTVVPILWGWASPGSQGYGAQLDVIYKQIFQSNYYRWIRDEYGAPELNLHPTVFATSPAPVPASSAMTLSAIEYDLAAMALGNVLPQDTNVLYVLHLAPGATVDDGSTLAAQCGPSTSSWGGRASANPRDYPYAIVFDPSTCAPQGIDSVTQTLSREVINMLTDPRPGVDGWADLSEPHASCMRIAGNCNQPTVITTPFVNPVRGTSSVVVDKVYSNKMGLCVTENALNVPLN